MSDGEFDHIQFDQDYLEEYTVSSPKGLTVGDLRMLLTRIEGEHNDENVLIESVAPDGSVQWHGVTIAYLAFGTDRGLYIRIGRIG